jgi:hypothetical protein
MPQTQNAPVVVEHRTRSWTSLLGPVLLSSNSAVFGATEGALAKPQDALTPQPLDLSAAAGELGLERLETPIQMVDAVDGGLAFGH